MTTQLKMCYVTLVFYIQKIVSIINFMIGQNKNFDYPIKKFENCAIQILIEYIKKAL